MLKETYMILIERYGKLIVILFPPHIQLRTAMVNGENGTMSMNVKVPVDEGVRTVLVFITSLY